MRAFFFDDERQMWCGFDDIFTVLETTCAQEIPLLITKMESLVREHSLYALGFITYEASLAFDAKYSVQKDTDLDSSIAEIELPLFSFTLYKTMKAVHSSALHTKTFCALSPFISRISQDTHAAKIALIKKHLFCGDTYQINYTIPMHARFSGDPLSWFFTKIAQKHGGYAAYVETQDYAICSLSPELFFRREKTHEKNNTYIITCKPMKGTKRRTEGIEEQQIKELQNDKKNRAENLMITDMVRNDLGKIALLGTVKVPSLCEIETYPTLFQMTSTVTALTQSNLEKTFASLFPSASITGAPKMRSMEIITELEGRRRGVYTGSIVLLRPDASVVSSVAIRTAVFDKKQGIAEYRVGGGIVWLSDPQQEYEECATKALAVRSSDNFYIFETMLLESGVIFLLDRHLKRLVKSALFFFIISHDDVASFLGRVQQELSKVISSYANGHWRVRLSVFEDGLLSIECSKIPPIPQKYTITLSKTRVNSSSFFLYHKTSVRSYIDEAIQAAPCCADVILINERDEITESTRGSVILTIQGKQYTPPLSSGLLPGVFREELLERGEIEERVCTICDYEKATSVQVVNSLRRKIEGWKL